MLLTMSDKELNRIQIIHDVSNKQLTQQDAAPMLRISRRHVQRLVNKYRTGGESALLSKRRNRPSNNAYPPEFKRTVLSLLALDYQGFGPTLACEKLAENYQIQLSSETIRQWMIYP